MRTSELMLGDIVRYKYEGELFYAKVLEVWQGCVTVVEIHGEYEPIELPPDHIEPVPLTLEILEKNGFKILHGFGYSEIYHTYGWGYHKDIHDYCSVDVTFYDESKIGISHLVKINTNSASGDGVNSVHSCDCDYVHVLQHLLRDAGIKKEIIL